jgi:hypothetical protein
VKNILCLFLLAFATLGCASQKGQMIIFENIQVRYDGAHPQQGPNAYIINSEERLKGVLAALQLTPRLGNPDLTAYLPEHTLILVYGGIRKTGGNRFHVTKILQKNRQLVVRARMLQPGPNCNTTSVISHPVQIIAVPKNATKHLALDFLESIQDCK